MEKVQIYLHKEISGETLNDLLGKESAYLIKFMNDDNVHKGMKYEVGLNRINDFNPSGECSKGGLYICHISDYHHWYERFGNYVCCVIIPNYARCYIEPRQIKCDQIIIGDKIQKDIALTQLFSAYSLLYPYKMLQLIKRYSQTIRFIIPQNRTYEMLIAAVVKNKLSIQYIGKKYWTQEMMMEVFKHDCSTLDNIDPEFQTKEMIEIYNKRKNMF